MEVKIRELYGNAEFMAELAQAKTFEDASALFARNGVNISADMLEEVVSSSTENGDQNLTEEMLDNVSGGGILIAGACLVGGYVLGRIIAKITP